jgi:hypothetical protein
MRRRRMEGATEQPAATSVRENFPRLNMPVDLGTIRRVPGGTDLEIAMPFGGAAVLTLLDFLAAR